MFPQLHPDNFFISPTTPNEIEKLISSLDSSKAVGPHAIPINLIKLANLYIAKPLSHIYNQSFLDGVFPDELKMSRIIPLHKGDCPYTLTNYRPISIFSPFSNILEKLMCNRLISFLDKHSVLYKYQFGFRKSHSTSLALIEIVDNLLHALDNGLYTLGVFMDFSKAFDTVNHQILLSKLLHYGVRGTAFNWFKSYLKDRPQFDDLNGAHFSVKTLLCGIPQGSNLGPLLFLIYINDIANCSKILKIRLFADDTNIFLEGKDGLSLTQQMNSELINITNWLKANKLSLNIKKSKYMIIASGKKQTLTSSIILDGNLLEETNSFKYLGVYVDNRLTWSDHIKVICKKIAKNIGIMSKLRHYLDLDSLRKVYFSLIYPYLQYGIVTWGNTYESRLNQLHVLNNKVLRIITFSDFKAHAPPIYKSLGILQLKDIVYLQKCMFIYDYHNNNLPDAFSNYFKTISEIHQYNTRSSVLGYHLPPVSSNFGKFSIKFSCSKIWNSIDKNIKVLPRKSFQKKIKDIRLQSYV